jgi:hypothetical protein
MPIIISYSVRPMLVLWADFSQQRVSIQVDASSVEAL